MISIWFWYDFDMILIWQTLWFFFLWFWSASVFLIWFCYGFGVLPVLWYDFFMILECLCDFDMILFWFPEGICFLGWCALPCFGSGVRVYRMNGNTRAYKVLQGESHHLHFCLGLGVLATGQQLRCFRLQTLAFVWAFEFPGRLQHPTTLTLRF